MIPPHAAAVAAAAAATGECAQSPSSQFPSPPAPRPSLSSAKSRSSPKDRNNAASICADSSQVTSLRFIHAIKATGLG